MRNVFYAIRSLLFVLFLFVTVVPWALTVLVVSMFARGNTVYWLCVGRLTTAIAGARVICGVQARLQGMENLPDADCHPLCHSCRSAVDCRADPRAGGV